MERGARAGPRAKTLESNLPYQCVVGTASVQRGAGRIEGLDALRGIAALLVLLFHVEFVFGLQPYFHRAYLSVDFFFLLSGALMARQYEGRFPQTQAFVRLRLHRLWPMMAIGGVLGTLLFAPQMGPLEAVLGCLMGLLFLPWLGSDKGLFPLNPPTWSILFELLANALHAALLHRIGTRQLVGLAAICAATLALFAPNLDLGSVRLNAALGIPRVVMSYALGIALWRLRERLPALPVAAGCVMLPVVIVALPQLPIAPLAGDMAFALIIAPLTLICGLGPLRFAKALLLRMGWLSFPLYALHYPVLMLVGRSYGPLVSAAAAIVAAAAAGYLVERFGRHGVFRKRSRSTAPGLVRG